MFEKFKNLIFVSFIAKESGSSKCGSKGIRIQNAVFKLCPYFSELLSLFGE
jgi:hypothetical protein